MRHDFLKVEYINTKFCSLKRNLKINNQFTKKIRKQGENHYSKQEIIKGKSQKQN